MQCQTPSVVQKEQRAALFCALVYGAHPEFVADAVTGTHQLSILRVRQFIGGIDAFRPAGGIELPCR